MYPGTFQVEKEAQNENRLVSMEKTYLVARLGARSSHSFMGVVEQDNFILRWDTTLSSTNLHINWIC